MQEAEGSYAPTLKNVGLTWQRNPNLYLREGLASRLRKQLGKLNLDIGRFLEGRSLDDLTADEVYVLAKILPGFSKEKRLQVYKGVLKGGDRARQC